MKVTQTPYDDLLKYYQSWLTDFTRLTVRLGICHQNIYASHELTVDYLRFQEGDSVAVVPLRLYRLIRAGTHPGALPACDASQGLEAHEHLLIHHPMLEGILLSECVRLKQRALANRLASLFHQFSVTQTRLKLVWLCWYDLMTGADLTDWIDNLKFKKDASMTAWLNARQGENGALAALMDEYVMFASRTTLPA